MARPPKDISAHEVELLAGCGATVGEIAAKLGCNKRTLERRFAAHINKGRESGRMSLRGKQYELAMKGNCAMLIWLGKQYLGQTDKYDLTTIPDEELKSEGSRIVNGVDPARQTSEVTNGRKRVPALSE